MTTIRPHGSARLRIVPLDLATANRAVAQWHRHHKPLAIHLWSLGCEDELGTLVGAAMAMRPVARRLDDGLTIEVARVSTDGTPNACSCLYGAMRRTAAAMGYERVITYILTTEPGTSLKASGWTLALTHLRASSPHNPHLVRPRHEHMSIPKQRWECWLVPESKRRPRVKPVFGNDYTGTLLEGLGT